jgi:hypothetical protein
MGTRYAVIDASMDLMTARMGKLVQAIVLTEVMPPATGRRLTKLARAARLFTEATEYRSAVEAIDELVSLIPDGEPEFAESRAAVVRAADRAKRSIGFVDKPAPLAVTAAA